MNAAPCIRFAPGRPLRRPALPLGRQRGVATLIVVMVLFFVVSLVAAYASRNLLFEQKTAANQYRSTAALEAAEAGLQWAVSLLNGGRIDANCLPSANLADSTFRDRYLGISESGAIAPRTLPPPSTDPLNPSCVFDGTVWQCSCPTDDAPALPVPAGTDMFPAFRLRFTDAPAVPSGLIRIEVNACTRADAACLNFPATGASNEGRVTVTAILALRGPIAVNPAAPLTARGNIAGSLAFTLANTDTRSGVTLHSGGSLGAPPLAVFVPPPGTPVNQSIVSDDASLAALSTAAADNRMFLRYFGLRVGDFQDQPGLVTLNCAGTCTAAQVRTAVSQFPGLSIWLNGSLDVDSGGDIGSPDLPVAIVATGSVSFTAAATVHGLIYTQAAPWTTAGVGGTTVRGAVISEGNVEGNSTATMIYDRDVLDQLRRRTGSFVVVPGSWKDF